MKMIEGLGYSFITAKDMTIQLSFDQGIIDWINQQYPDRNWVTARGPTFTKTCLLEDEFDKTPALEIRTMELPDFAFPINIFWKMDHKTIKRLIVELVEHLEASTKPGADIYLMNLVGELVFVNGDSEVDKITDTNGQLLGSVGANWSLRCYL